MLFPESPTFLLVKSYHICVALISYHKRKLFMATAQSRDRLHKDSVIYCEIGTSTQFMGSETFDSTLWSRHFHRICSICVRVLKTRIPHSGIGSSTKIGTIKAAGLILRFHSVESTLPQRSLKSVGEFRTFDSTVWNRLFHKKRRNHKESSEPFFSTMQSSIQIL